MGTYSPPAFPQPDRDEDSNARTGLSMRDYFAGQALAGGADAFCDALGPHGPTTDEDIATHAARHAKAAYMLADAMLKAREQ